MEQSAIEVEVARTDVMENAFGGNYSLHQCFCAAGKGVTAEEGPVLDSRVVVPAEPKLFIRSKLFLGCLEERIRFYGRVQVGSEGPQLFLI